MNQQPVNEVARIVADLSDLIRTRPDAMQHPFGSECRIYIAGDLQPSGQVAWTMIGEVEWDYHLVKLLCRERAVNAEFGRLLANGVQLPAEKYLALWRTAGAKPMPLLELVKFGLTPIFEATLPTPVCKDRENYAAWLASPTLVSTDLEKTVWHVPLDCADAFVLAAQLRDVYWSTETYGPGYGKTYRLRGNPQPQVATQTTKATDLVAEAA